MTTFTGTSSIAVTWTASGQCRGVYLERVRDRCRLVRFWEGHKSADRSVAETLAEGLRSLRPGGNTVVVAGGDDLASGFIDLEMPALRPAELRSALTFELRRCAPVPDEKLVWAHRVLPGKSGPRQRVRVYYVRQTVWERWMGDVSGLTHGLDMVIPPAAALDPVLSGVPVVMGGDDATRFLFACAEDGRRDVQVLPESGEVAGAFGSGATPLNTPTLIPGELAGLPAGKQASFGAAVILAMYGLSHCLHGDRRTGFELPYEVRSRRHRQSRLLALALAVYIAVVGLYGAARLYADRQHQYESIHGERVRLEAQIEEASKRLDQNEAKLIEQLRKEVADLSQPRPSLAAAMAEITRRVGRSGWCTSFRWNEGAIGIQLRETQEIEDLERTLEQSPLLGDVRQESKIVQAGVIDRKVEMNARYDIGEERSAPPPAQLSPKDEEAGAEEVDDSEGAEDAEAVEQTGAAGAEQNAAPRLRPPRPPGVPGRGAVRGAAPAATPAAPAPGTGTIPPPPPPPPAP